MLQNNKFGLHTGLLNERWLPEKARGRRKKMAWDSRDEGDLRGASRWATTERGALVRDQARARTVVVVGKLSRGLQVDEPSTQAC